MEFSIIIPTYNRADESAHGAAGLRGFYVPDMNVHHVIEPERLKKQYFGDGTTGTASAALSCSRSWAWTWTHRTTRSSIFRRFRSSAAALVLRRPRQAGSERKIPVPPPQLSVS